MQPRREEPSGNTVNEKSQNRTTKMKTHIIITDAKESERFPGKNQILLGHTVDWLAGEADDTMEFWYVSREDEIFPEGRIDPATAIFYSHRKIKSTTTIRACLNGPRPKSTASRTTSMYCCSLHNL